ncbi:MAG: AI-2E family transporter, partial [Streptococcaceae bacterium]|nr:AI-2E family transporter [Streptococcaceae bacterium]
MEKEQTKTWFFKWFLNSKTVTGLIIILLFLLNVLVFTKVSHVFTPVAQFFEIIGVPVIMSVVMYYMLFPVIKFLEKRGINRLSAIIGVYVVLLGLIIWGIVVIIPLIQTQTVTFFKNFPGYVRTVDNEVQNLLNIEILHQFRPQLDQIGNTMSTRLIEWAQNLSQMTFTGLGSVVGTITTVVIGIVTMPFILFFLLKDGDNLLDYGLQFLPKKWQKKTGQVLGEVNNQISSYIRGQLTVALAVAIMFTILFSIIGLDFAIILGIS